MNKELFVSSTPHETKVGLVEDDLLAEVYLERENEYTLAGSIYKGRVTRVLPGMQSAFVDIGLERDAFLYVSDFMDLEDHDEDATDVVPAGRGVTDMRSAGMRTETSSASSGSSYANAAVISFEESGEESDTEERIDGQDASQSASSASSARDSQDRGGLRGRRRRRGGRRDGREREVRDRSEPRTAAPPVESAPASVAPIPHFNEPRRAPSAPQFGPPAGYQPILLPGESISKYRGMAPPAAAEARPPAQSPAHVEVEPPAEFAPPLASTFSDGEPIFVHGEVEPIAQNTMEEMEENVHPALEESSAGSSAFPETSEPTSASTTMDWNREFHRRDTSAPPATSEALPGIYEHDAVEHHIVPQDAPTIPASEQKNRFEHYERASEDQTHHEPSINDHSLDDRSHRQDSHGQDSHDIDSRDHQPQASAFAAPGTMEEETIDEDEVESAHYEESSDEGYDEFEEETQDAGSKNAAFSEIRATVAEIHMTSLAESGLVPAEHPEAEDDSEELELEEAQAKAEALLDAESSGGAMVEARAEVRAPASTAGFTQRAPRPRPERGGFERRGGGRRPGGRRFPRREPQEVPKISDLLKEGQEILVQIAKEPIAKKGARITSHIALPGRFLVYMPTVNHTGVSRKISSEEERQRLKRIVISERENGHGGFIVRTAAQHAPEEELRADIRFLKGLWNDIKTRAEASKPPALIYHDLNVVERILRDQVTSDFSVVWVDTEPEYERILRFFNRFQPSLVKKVKLYTKETPLFEQFGLAEEMNKALKSKVWLKSGGYIVINQTEALVAIDINTGKYVGKTSRLEDTIVKTNVDAIKEIVRQVRLRDLGGIIIIDFIDMDERRNRQRVMQALEEELKHDRAPSKVLQFNDFGLVAITRKRVKQSLERTIGAPCPYCESTGYVKSVTTVCNEVYVEMRKIIKHLERQDVMLRVHPEVAKELKGNNGRLLNEMEELTKRTIIVKSDATLHQEQFDIN